MNFAELDEMELYSAKKCAVYFADRCKLLEQLCRDMWQDHVWLCEWTAKCQTNDEIQERMEQLGLLECEQNGK